MSIGMKSLVVALILSVAAPSPGDAQPTGELASDQKGYIAYHQCLMHAAMRISRTDAEDDEVYGLAKAECAATREQVIVGHEANRVYLVALDALDAEKAASFPAWTKGVRERRRARETAFGVPADMAR